MPHGCDTLLSRDQIYSLPCICYIFTRLPFFNKEVAWGSLFPHLNCCIFQLEGFGEWLRPTFAGKNRNCCFGVVLVVMVGSRLDGLDDFSGSVTYDVSLQLYLETPYPCFSSSAVYSALMLAKGIVENLQLFKRSNV